MMLSVISYFQIIVNYFFAVTRQKIPYHEDKGLFLKQIIKKILIKNADNTIPMMREAIAPFSFRSLALQKKLPSRTREKIIPAERFTNQKLSLSL